jgi:signal transduction histidine kinase
MSADRVIGVLRVEPESGVEFDAGHVSLLSVLAAQLGAYYALVFSREEVALRAQQLAKAHEFQQRLAAIVSHDLRTPLSVIMTTASTCLKTASDPDLVQTMKRLLRNAIKSARIVQDLLDVTHTQVAGVIPVKRRTTDLHAVVKEVVEDARVAHPRATIELSVSVRGSPRDQWDAERLAQVVQNLINNAVQHGDPARPVRVHLRMNEAAATLSVRNRGRVIPAEFLPRIFDPFVHGPLGEREPKTGLGLGLYIVSQIAKAHGGLVHVTSTPGAGTAFKVRLPRAARDRKKAERPASRGDASS